jgi:hypothetical protein
MTKEEQDFVAAVQAALTSDLVPKEYRDRPDNPMFGQCYGAAEALYRLLGGKERGYKAQRATDNDGISHWWILSPAGEILDPTSAQYIDFGKVPPYDRGRGVAFRSRSRRAEIIVERVSSSAKTSITSHSR